MYKVGVFTEPGKVFVSVGLILYGSYFLGVLSPHFMAIISARVAAAVIYKTIDRVIFKTKMKFEILRVFNLSKNKSRQDFEKIG